MYGAFSQLFFALNRIFKIRITTVNNDVSFFEQGEESVDDTVYRGAGLNQHHDASRLFQAFDKILEFHFSGQILASEFFNKFFHDLRGTIINHGAVSLTCKITGKIRTHNSKTNDSDFSFFHKLFFNIDTIFLQTANP